MDPIQEALKRVQQQELQQQAVGQQVQAAMNQPQKLVQHLMAAVGIRNQDGVKVLMIATPDGTRQDIQLSPAALTMIKQALLGELES